MGTSPADALRDKNKLYNGLTSHLKKEINVLHQQTSSRFYGFVVEAVGKRWPLSRWNVCSSEEALPI